jgi:hypothetical protein
VFWQHFIEGLIIYLIASIFLFYVRLSSFLYFAALYDVSPVGLQEFLNQPRMRFSVLKIIFSGKPLYDLWERNKRRNLAELRRNRLASVPFVVISVLLIAPSIVQGNSFTLSEAIPSVFWLLVLIATFVFSWRFGHSLKHYVDT